MMQRSVEWLQGDAETVARRLLGCDLVRRTAIGQEVQEVRVRIVETEAYDETDEASHTFRGRTKRNDMMYGSAGQLYVYFTYGMHYCMNIVCGPEGVGEAVLIRAVEPLAGTDIIENNRGITGVGATNGPAKTCQALAVDARLNGHDLSQPPLQLIKKRAIPASEITTTKRVGIRRAMHLERRFYITGNAYVSRP